MVPGCMPVNNLGTCQEKGTTENGINKHFGKKMVKGRVGNQASNLIWKHHLVSGLNSILILGLTSLFLGSLEGVGRRRQGLQQ